MAEKLKVGYIGLGEVVEDIPPARGKRQLLRINEFLIDAQASGPYYDEILSLRIQKKILPSLPPFAQIYFRRQIRHPHIPIDVGSFCQSVVCDFICSGDGHCRPAHQSWLLEPVSDFRC